MIHAPVWDNAEKTILYIRHEGSWTWDEFNQKQHIARAMINEVEHPVALIAHMVDAAAARPPHGALGHWSAAMDDESSRKLHKVILVSDSLIVRTFVEISHRVLNPNKAQKLHVVDSLDKARTLVNHTHPTQV